MRVNVYSQELTKEVTLVDTSHKDGVVIHQGVRFWMHSPDELHNEPDDDDRSAVTFWIPNAVTFTKRDLAAIFVQAANLLLPPSEHLNSVARSPEFTSPGQLEGTPWQIETAKPQEQEPGERNGDTDRKPDESGIDLTEEMEGGK